MDLEARTDEEAIEESIEDKPAEETPFEPVPLKKGILPVWRARCITPYNSELLPPEPVPLQEEVFHSFETMTIFFFFLLILSNQRVLFEKGRKHV